MTCQGRPGLCLGSKGDQASRAVHPFCPCPGKASPVLLSSGCPHGLGLHHMGSGIEGCLFEGRVRQTDRQIHACVQVFHLPGHSKMPNQQEPTALPCSPTQVAVAWGILRCLPKSISSKLDRKQSNQVLTWGFWVGKQWFNMPHCHPSSASGSAL